jgi:uncharacterized protein (TIGR04255 family)
MDMSQDKNAVPKKLRHDAIVEAVFEARFEMKTLPEVFFGRLADYEPWKGFTQAALPAAGIPAFVRQSDPNLRYQPVFQLSNVDGLRSIRVGQYVASYHRAAPYVGWERFRDELNEFIDGLFLKAAEGLSVSRLGIRYINALKIDPPGISAITDLNMEVSIANEKVQKSVNVNYLTEHSNNTQSIVRISTTDLILGTAPPDTVLLVDVDVYTKPGFKTGEIADVKQWAEFAHTEETKQFFRLLKQKTKESLAEVW